MARQKSHALAPHEIQRKPRFNGTFGPTHQTSYNPHNQPYTQFSTQVLQNIESKYRVREPLDDDAFKLAFDAAEQSVSNSAEYTQQEFSAPIQKALINRKPENSAPGLDFPSSGKDQVRSDETLESAGESQQGVHDADGLARTAGELLDKVKHDSNPKFQNSSFLSLMRQLRDREVHVEGDRIVNVSGLFMRTLQVPLKLHMLTESQRSGG